MALKETARDIAEGIHIYQNRYMWRALVKKGTEFSDFMNVGEIFNCQELSYKLFKEDLVSQY